MTVPILDLTRSFKEIKPEVFEALEKIFDAQSFILGPDVKAFETHCEKYLELPEGSAVSCASGTDALLLALMACDIKLGDEVITTPFTFFATSGTIARLGATPVYVDVDPLSYNINLEQAVSKITKKTKAFLPVQQRKGCHILSLKILNFHRSYRSRSYFSGMILLKHFVLFL